MPGVDKPAAENIWVLAGDGKLGELLHCIRAGGENGQPMDVNIQDDSGYTPLHAACSYGHIELVQSLVQHHEANINIQDNDGDAPLHLAETVDMAQTLVELGADPEIRNHIGLLVLMVNSGN